MSATTTASAASAACTGNRWILPTQDAACAVPAGGNYSDILDKCCSPAKIESYDGGCGLYCLAQGQNNVSTLLNCITDNGGVYGDVFCNANLSATATAPAPTATETGDKGGRGGSSETPTSSKDGEDTKDNAGVVNQPVSKSGVGLLLMVFCSALIGVAV